MKRILLTSIVILIGLFMSSCKQTTPKNEDLRNQISTIFEENGDIIRIETIATTSLAVEQISSSDTITRYVLEIDLENLYSWSIFYRYAHMEHFDEIWVDEGQLMGHLGLADDIEKTLYTVNHGEASRELFFEKLFNPYTYFLYFFDSVEYKSRGNSVYELSMTYKEYLDLTGEADLLGAYLPADVSDNTTINITYTLDEDSIVLETATSSELTYKTDTVSGIFRTVVFITFPDSLKPLHIDTSEYTVKEVK